MGESEYGKCDICEKDNYLTRRYYKYPIKCDCCNSKQDDHFEIVYHCTECEPRPPRSVKVNIMPKKDAKSNKYL
jgi:hypothetical protein